MANQAYIAGYATESDLSSKADLSAIHGDYITNGESTISANRAWSETRGYVWTVTISLGTYVLSCNEDGTSTWDQCELLEDGEGYEFWGRTIGCYEDDILFFKLEYDIEGAVFHLTMKDKRDSWPADEYTLVPDEPLMQYLPHGPFGNWDAIVSYMPWTKTGILTTEDYVDEAISSKADLSTIPTKTSDLSNDSGFITSADLPVKPIPFTIKQDRSLYPSSQTITIKTSSTNTLSVKTNPNGNSGTFVASFLISEWNSSTTLADVVTAPDTVGCFVFKTSGQMNDTWGNLKTTLISNTESFGIALPL